MTADLNHEVGACVVVLGCVGIEPIRIKDQEVRDGAIAWSKEGFCLQWTVGCLQSAAWRHSMWPGSEVSNERTREKQI